MAHETEAACLLRTGALYPLRLGLRPNNGDDVFLGVKPGAFSIYFGDAPIYHFDLDGRWQRAFIDGLHYLKGLDTTVDVVDRVREGENLVLKRRSLGFAETVDLDARVRAMAIDLLDRLGSTDSLAPPEGSRALSEGETRSILEEIIRWDAAAWFAHRERYLGTYGVLPFLPPETSQPVIVQATLGHRRGLGFGGAPASTYHERTDTDFNDHVRTVARLMGRRALQCRQVFLAGADALRRPFDAIVRNLDAINATFAIEPGRSRPRARDVDVLGESPVLDGIHAFVHEFDGPALATEQWRELQSKHLQRLILGIESGSARVRSLYGHDWPEEGLRDWISACPIGLGLVVLVGAGGIEHAAEHLEETTRLLASLPIPSGTLVSLVDVDDLDRRAAADRGFTPLGSVDLATQRAEWKSRLVTALGPRKIKVTTYATDKRWQ